MLTQLLLLFIAFFFSFILYPIWIKFVYKFQMGEDVRNDGPKTHLAKKGTPTMGGIVVIFVVAVMTIFLNRSRTQTLFPVFVAALAGLFGILEDFSKVYRKSGLPDFLTLYLGFTRRWFKRKQKEPVLFTAASSRDLFRGYSLFVVPWRLFKEFARIVGSSSDKGLQTHYKFIIQGFIAGFASLWAYFKLGWDYIWFPLIGDVHLGVLYPLIIFFAFLVVLNFVAFTDGLDGLAGGLALFALCAFWVISVKLEYNLLAGFIATFVGALLPFLYFNVYPARIFMGNVGSHVFGAVFMVLSIVLHREIALVFILAVFLVDGFSSPLQQLAVKLVGKRLFRMAPLHHHFEMLGWPESKVVFRFWTVGIFFAFLGIFVALV